MIGSIKGILELKDHPYIIVDVNGVGYKVLIPENEISNLSINQKVKFFIYTHVREDTLDLYGFTSLNQMKLFEKLIGVSGIGPKTAMGIFSIGTDEEITQAIIKGDVSFFLKVPRLGKKNAQKVIIELKTKFESTGDIDLSSEMGKENKDVLAALKIFGYTVKEATEALRNTGDKGKTIEEKIKLALRYLGK